MREQNYYAPIVRTSPIFRITATVDGIERLVICLHYPDYAALAAVDAQAVTCYEDVLRLRMAYSELEYRRYDEESVHVLNGKKGGAYRKTKSTRTRE